MKLNPRLKHDVEKFKEYTMLVEGKKDVVAMNAAGFENVHDIHRTSVSLQERLEQIAELIGKKEKVCILTDFDKKGKTLYLKTKTILQELGVKIDSTFRGLLIKAQISHIEEIYEFFKKVEKIG